MNEYLLNTIFNSKHEDNIKLNFNTDRYIYKKNKKLINTFKKLNFNLLNKKNIPKFLFQTLMFENNGLKFFVLSTFNENWDIVTCEERLTKEYKHIYNKILMINKKNKFNCNKLQNINNIMYSKDLQLKLSVYYLNNYDSLYLFISRLKKFKYSNISQLIKPILNILKKFENDIVSYNYLYKKYIEKIRYGIKKNISLKTAIKYYLINKYIYQCEIISACDYVYMLRKIMRKYNKYSRIYFYKNIHFTDYNILYNKTVVYDVLKDKDDFVGHSTMLYFDFIRKKLIYFDPDVDSNYYYKFYPNKIKPLLQIAFEDKMWDVESIYMNKFAGFSGSIQSYYSNYNSNFEYCCTILSSMFGILSAMYPRKKPEDIFDIIMFKVKNNEQLEIIKRKGEIYKLGWKQLVQWIANIVKWLE